MTEQQRNNLAKMEKQGWEAADWKARALDSTQKIAAANAQVHLWAVPSEQFDTCGLPYVVAATVSWSAQALSTRQGVASGDWVFTNANCRALTLVHVCRLLNKPGS